MIPSSYTYLMLDVATIFFPLVLSFDRKVAFYKHWWRLFPSIFIAGFVFLVWDYLFTAANVTFQAVGKEWTGIWNFNPEYLSGFYILNLPVEEVLFFLVVPYACVFIYEVLIAYLSANPFENYYTSLNWLVFTGCVIMGVIFWEKVYTSVTFMSMAILLLVQILLKTKYMGWFYLMWLVHLLPFAIINGFLTALPVVVYNNLANLSVRIYTIPLEDAFYSFTLLLLTITIYEYFGTNFPQARASTNR